MGRQAREGGAYLSSDGRIGGRGVGIELISVCFLLDDGEAGDAVERIRLHSKPGRGDHVAAMGTDSVRPRVEGCQRLLNPAKFFDGKHFHGQGDIEIVLGGSLVDRVGKDLGFRGNQMGYRGFVREYHFQSMEFVPKIRVILALPYMKVWLFRWNTFLDMVR